MIRNISVGIDIGTLTTRVVVGEFTKGEKYPKIIGVGESETHGMRHGYVVNISEAKSSTMLSFRFGNKQCVIIKIFLSINF